MGGGQSQKTELPPSKLRHSRRDCATTPDILRLCLAGDKTGRVFATLADTLPPYGQLNALRQPANTASASLENQRSP